MTNDQARVDGADEAARNSSQVGKGLEYLRIFSGKVTIIDQFMLGNGQFTARLKDMPTSAGAAAAVEELVEKYGGCVVSLEAGYYEVHREPVQNLFVLKRCGDADFHPGEGNAESFDFSRVADAKGHFEAQHHVFVDTRCLVFLDAELLFNGELVERYSSLRHNGQDKQARDLLRSHGAAVRYGFNRHGDELGVFWLEQEGVTALWPDIPG